MDTKLKSKWVKALRSDKYKQAQRCLRDPFSGGLCCLGVLADIQGAEWNGATPRINNQDVRRDGEGFLGDLACAGLIKREQDTLAGMNDTGKTFAEIADYIEKHL